MIRYMKSHGHLGVAEVAELLGVSRQRVYQLRVAYPDFPVPVAELTSGPVWHESELLAWQSQHPDRRSGRPT